MIFLKKRKFVICIFAFALLFRIMIAPLALNGDLLTQAEWGKWEYINGTKGLYEWNQWLNEWPNHPPLISLVYMWTYQLHSFLMKIFSNVGNFIALHRLAPTKFWWFYNFIIWFGNANFPNTFFSQGIVFVIKLQMIISDLLIAGLIYFLCKKAKVNWKKYMLAYLFLPFSWYLSALWGQSDQLAFLFLIFSFILLVSRFFWISTIIFAISINLKPTGLILIPLFLWIWYRQKKPFIYLIISGIISFILFLWMVSIFTNKQPIDFLVNNLCKRLFLTKPPFTTVSAFNFWYIFHAKDLISETTIYFFLKAKIWGYILFLIVSIISFLQIKKGKIETIFMAIFTSGFGGWLFITNMYERYLFTGLVSLLFLSIYKKKMFKYFVVLSTIYLFNMYNGWWFPENLTILKNIFLWNSRFFTRILSIANVLIYIHILFSLRNDYLPKLKKNEA